MISLLLLATFLLSDSWHLTSIKEDLRTFSPFPSGCLIVVVTSEDTKDKIRMLSEDQWFLVLAGGFNNWRVFANMMLDSITRFNWPGVGAQYQVFSK